MLTELQRGNDIRQYILRCLYKEKVLEIRMFLPPEEAAFWDKLDTLLAWNSSSDEQGTDDI